MQSKQLFQTMLITHFSKPSARPLTNALLRLVVGLGGAIGLGGVLSGAIRHAVLPQDLPQMLLISVALCVGFIIGGFVLLALGSSQSATQRGTVFQRITKLMPLSRSVRWLLAMSPALIVLSIVGAFGAIIANTVAQQMSVAPRFIIVAWTLGLLAGQGFMTLKHPRSIALKSLIFMLIVCLSLFIFDKVIGAASENTRTTLLIGLDTLLLLPLFGLVQSYWTPIALPMAQSSGLERPLIPNVLPHGAWFLIKLWRNKRTKSSIMLAIALSLSTALILLLKHKTFEDPYGILLFGAILAATFACDVRGVMRRHIPPEMVLLKGAKGIVTAEILAVMICGLIIGLPVFMALHSSASNAFLFITFYIAVQTFASLAGLFASTLFVPGAGDTGSQFFAAALASTAIICLPKIGHFSDINYDSQSLYWLAASLVLGAVIYITELTRRRNYGRT